MFEHLTLREQLRIEQEENRKLKADIEQLAGDMVYIAMMGNIDLDQSNEEVENDG